MGTFLGHASTGSFFFIIGFFIFVRSLNLKRFSILRTSDTLLTTPSVLIIFGGVVYTLGEYGGMVTSHVASPMSHLQHFLMSFWFILGGVVQLLHMKRKFKGVGFLFFYPLMFIVLSILFGTHPQPLPSLNMGHKIMSLLFLCQGVIEALILLSGQFFNRPHIISRLKYINYNVHNYDSNCTLPTQMPPPACDCGCGIKKSNISPIYNNPVIYTTGLPSLQAFVLMFAGCIDWVMAMVFFRHQYFDVSFEEMYKEQVGSDMDMDDMDEHSEDGETMASMQALANILWIMMGLVVFQVIVAFILSKIDTCKNKNQNESNKWRDELFNGPVPHDCPN